MKFFNNFSSDSPGPNYRKYYLACHRKDFHLKRKSHWHWFPAGQVPAITQRQAPFVTVAAASRPRRPRINCDGPNCPRKANRECRARPKRCKTYCYSSSCAIHSTVLKVPALSTGPPAAPEASFSADFLRLLDAVAQKTLAPLAHTTELLRLQQLPSQQTAAIRMTTSLSPSPTLSQEAYDRAYALELALGDSSSPPPPQRRRRLSPPLSGASTSQRHLSPLRRLSYPLSAVSSSHRRPAPIPAAASTGQTRRFVLVYWAFRAKPATVTVMQDHPEWRFTWPFIELSHCRKILSQADDNYNVDGFDDTYECYSLAYQTWMSVPHNYPHRVSTDQPLLIRRVGVVGLNESKHIAHLRRFMATTGDEQPILSDSIPEDAVKKIKIEPRTPPPPPPRESDIIEISDSDSEDEVKKIEPRTPPPRRKVDSHRTVSSLPASSSVPSLSHSVETSTSRPTTPTSPGHFPRRLMPRK
ncbi:hypothetical protein K438DRAFT_2010149 [Mycena galopus ATCC 62051]|nr:hypothetical protein K438DRAFT_2010149 [Mycena galopus ATCC 62051]